jgi:hypothetical protein
MKNIKIASIALLIAALPLAPAAFAHERDHDQYESQRSARNWEREEHEDRRQNWGHEHRHSHYCRHDEPRYSRTYYRDYDGYENRGWETQRTQVILPLPPLPPLLVPGLHKGHLVLRPAF